MNQTSMLSYACIFLKGVLFDFMYHCNNVFELFVMNGHELVTDSTNLVQPLRRLQSELQIGSCHKYREYN